MQALYTVLTDAVAEARHTCGKIPEKHPLSITMALSEAAITKAGLMPVARRWPEEPGPTSLTKHQFILSKRPFRKLFSMNIHFATFYKFTSTP